MTCECEHCQAQRTPWARSIVAERDGLRVENLRLRSGYIELRTHRLHIRLTRIINRAMGDA